MGSIRHEVCDFVSPFPNTPIDLPAVLQLNARLEEEAKLSRLNERLLEARLRELDELRLADDRLHWLTFARLTELALYCAGNYADTFQFREAGDLLVNPRLILIIFKGNGRACAKKRHMGISRQLGSRIDQGENPAVWLKKNVSTQIREVALLPECSGQMKTASALSEEYVSSVEERMKKVADTIPFLSAWKVRDNVEFHRRLMQVSTSERKTIEAQLCRFDKRTFDELGHDVYEIACNALYPSRFLRSTTATI